MKEEIKKILNDAKRYLQQQESLFGDEVTLSKSESEGEGKIQQVNEKEYGVDPTWINSKTLDELESKIKNCVKCPLGKTRTNFVFGVGNPKSEIVFIGEAPGAEEDLQGEPFVGRAGQLLNHLLASVGFRRDEVYICNVLKCRPPGNRDPQPSEIEACGPYLIKQLEIIKPKLIVSLGRFPAQMLLKTNATLSSLRGQIYEWKGIKMIVTYHPAAALRNQQWKRPLIEDLRKAREILYQK
jgi:uracil-DNA glycosylase family 4